MKNHTEILEEIASRMNAYEQSGGEMEEDLWPPAREVLAELRAILEKADPPVDASSNR